MGVLILSILNILNPNETTHSIILQPRFIPSGDLIVYLTNDITEVVTTLSNSYTYVSGVLIATFDLDVLAEDKFSIKINNQSKIIYKGSIFCTSQDSQDFKLTQGIYKYAE